MRHGRAAAIFAAAGLGAATLAACPKPERQERPAVSASAPLPAPLPAPDAGVADTGPPDAGPAPFALVTADVDLVVSGIRAVFPLENGLVVSRRNRLVPVAGPMVDLAPERLHAGLPEDPRGLAVRITGLVGRFPDAAFLAVSRDHVWGGGQIFRFAVDRWVPVAGSTRQNGLVAGADVSAGPALVIEEDDFVGDERGPDLVVPLLRAPVPGDPFRVAVRTPALVDGFVASLPSGHFFAVGTEPERAGRGLAQHFSPGSRTPVVRVLPFFPRGVSARSPSDAYTVGGADEKGPCIAHFDGQAWTLVPPPPTRGALGSVAQLADGSLFVTSIAPGAQLWRRAPDGGWTRVEPRFRAEAPAPIVDRVFTGAGGELHVIAHEGDQSVLLVQRSGRPASLDGGAR